MTANVRVQLKERTVLAVPARAIRRENGQSVVHVLKGDEPAARPVRVGWRDGPWVEIVNGLKAGERVLVNAASVPEEEKR